MVTTATTAKKWILESQNWDKFDLEKIVVKQFNLMCVFLDEEGGRGVRKSVKRVIIHIASNFVHNHVVFSFNFHSFNSNLYAVKSFQTLSMTQHIILWCWHIYAYKGVSNMQLSHIKGMSTMSTMSTVSTGYCSWIFIYRWWMKIISERCIFIALRNLSSL